MIKVKYLIITFFALASYYSFSQCEQISKDIWHMVKYDDYSKMDSLLLPIEMQRKIQHWPNNSKSNRLLKQLRDTLIDQIINSGKKLKAQLLNKKLDLKTVGFSKCKMLEDGQINVYVSDKTKEYTFSIQTLLVDKLYLVLPINGRPLPKTSFIVKKNNKLDEISCTDNDCSGTFKGPEFVNGIDIAHRFSNTISTRVGDQLKALYNSNKYSKVDFDNIVMTTEGMGSGTVTYYLKIPFIKVDQKCEAYTSFDHVGGWDHEPNLIDRKKELKGALMEGHQLNISELKTTKEGLQEYWIQWKNKVTQADCE